MIKIGILPTTKIYEDDNPYNDIYKFYNIYTKRIYESGAIPIGILLNDGELDENSLDICDAFLIGGGKKIEPYFLETINYAIKNNKPLLGICLGMQTIALYSYLESQLTKENKELNIQNFSSLYKKLKEEKVEFLKPIENHYKTVITRDNYLENIHTININKDSLLHSIYKKDEIDVLSMHNYAVNKYGDNVLINCTEDNIIEGLEYKDKNLFILGVQWHPEPEEKNNVIFDALIKEAKKRKNN